MRFHATHTRPDGSSWVRADLQRKVIDPPEEATASDGSTSVRSSVQLEMLRFTQVGRDAVYCIASRCGSEGTEDVWRFALSWGQQSAKPACCLLQGFQT